MYFAKIQNNYTLKSFVGTLKMFNTASEKNKKTPKTSFNFKIIFSTNSHA